MVKASLVLAITLLFSFSLTIFAETSTSDKANTLNKLTILQGNGIDFNLNGQLSRSEAITFIIRIMGQEKDVLDNKTRYSQTSFSDVKNEDWFAPYIGYAEEQKIVSGFPDGKYHPGENVSEKAFLKLVLGALGYKEGTDFTWDNVYLFAYRVGIVSDTKYATQTEDQLLYLRSEVVNVLYSALTKPINKSQQTIIDKLIASKMISRDIAMQLGLAKDSITTAINNTTAINTSSIEVNVNEELETITNSNLRIYETDNPNNLLSAQVEKQSGNQIIIKTGIQKANQPYTIELNNVIDHEGNSYSKIASSFSGYLIPEVKTIVANNENQFTITLNKKLKSILASNIDVHETNNTTNKLSVNIDSVNDATLIIKTSKQKEDQSYTIVISGIEELAPESVMSASFTGYKIPEVKSDLFKISKVVSVSKNVINVYFTQPVGGNIAVPFYYEVFKDNASYVKGSFNTMSVKTLAGQDQVISIFLKENSIDKDAHYTLKLNGDATSLYGVRLNNGNGDSATFSNNTNDNQSLNVTNVAPLDNKSVLLQFSKEIDPVSAMQLSNYALKGTNGIPSAILKVSIPKESNGTAVILSVGGVLNKNTDYQLTIKNITDNFGQFILPEMVLPFPGEAITEHKDLQIANVTAVDKSTIQVYFDRGLDSTSASNIAFYTISGVSDSFMANPQSVYFDPREPYKVTLFLPIGKELSSLINYVVRASNLLLDSTGSASLKNAEMTFSGSGDSNTKPLVIEAKTISADTIRIRTSKELSTSAPNTMASNYWLEAKDGNNTTITKNASSVSIIDAKTVVIKFDPLDLTKSYTLKFTSLADYSGINVRTAADGYTSISVDIGQ